MNDIKLSYTQRFALRFVKWACPPDLYETIEGDLIEQFEIDVEEVGLKKARRRFFWNASMQPKAWRRCGVRTSPLSIHGEGAGMPTEALAQVGR
jgi:hypothetical protein